MCYDQTAIKDPKSHDQTAIEDPESHGLSAVRDPRSHGRLSVMIDLMSHDLTATIDPIAWYVYDLDAVMDPLSKKSCIFAEGRVKTVGDGNCYIEPQNYRSASCKTFYVTVICEYL